MDEAHAGRQANSRTVCHKRVNVHGLLAGESATTVMSGAEDAAAAGGEEGCEEAAAEGGEEREDEAAVVEAFEECAAVAVEVGEEAAEDDELAASRLGAEARTRAGLLEVAADEAEAGRAATVALEVDLSDSSSP